MHLEINRKNFLPHQYDFLLSDKKLLALVAGYGSGKTYGFLRKTLINHIYNKRDIDGLSNGWIIYPTLDLANELFVDDFQVMLDDLDIDHEYNIAKGRFRSKYGSIKMYTLEQPKRMVGANLTYVGFDEFDTVKTEQAMQAYKKAIGRMRGNENAQLYIVTTPEGFRATYKIFVENKKSNQHILHAKTTDNPYLPKSYIDLLLEEYDPILLKAYMDGKFVNLNSGSVYYSFDRDKHVSKFNLPIMNGFPVNICFDFNVYPYSVSWNQCLADNNIRWLGEWVSKRHSNTYEACENIKKSLPDDIDVVIYGDASGRSDSAQSTVTNYQIIESELKPYFRSLNYRVPKSNPAVKDRVNNVNSKFSKDHIIINPCCEKLILDLEQVVWNEKTSDIDKSDIERTHISDGAGYYISVDFPIKHFKNKHKTHMIE